MKSKAQTILFRALIAVLALAVFVSPFAVLVSAYLLTTPVYGNTFYGELDDKYDALYRAQGEKIVLIGGSSVAFGYDSETLSTLFDRPVINFGLYAALGTKLMLDLSEDAIGEGDIVLLAPELDPETLAGWRFGRPIPARNEALEGPLSECPGFSRMAFTTTHAAHECNIKV